MLISGGGACNLMPNQGFSGFTLAEVLLTLGIIGVVAALTIPAVIQNYQAIVLHAQLKKSYSTLQQALERMSVDRGERVKAGDFPVWSFARPYSEYFNTVLYCGNTGCVGQESEDIEGEGMQYVIANYKTYSKSRNVATDTLDDGQFMVYDGTLYMIENPNPQNLPGHLFVTVDVNGYKRLPNAWGHDMFTFQIMSDGKVLPMGAESTLYTNLDTYCSPDSNHRENGIGCTEKALTDKNYFKNLPR